MNTNSIRAGLAAGFVSLVFVFHTFGQGWARAPLLDEARGVLTIAPMLETITPAVVNISVVARAAPEDDPLLRDPFFRRYFDLPQAAPGRPELSRFCEEAATFSTPVSPRRSNCACSPTPLA